MANRKRPETNGKAAGPRHPGEAPVTLHQWLDWHLDNGTRPGGTPGTPGRLWTSTAFAEAIGVSDRTVRNWRNGKTIPDDLESIERVLLGNDPAWTGVRRTLRDAFNAARTRPAMPTPAEPPLVVPITPPDRCFGRDEHVAHLTAALTAEADAAVLVLGPGGIGKTTSIGRPDLVARLDQFG